MQPSNRAMEQRSSKQWSNEAKWRENDGTMEDEDAG